VLGSDGEGGEAVGAEEEKHRVGEGIQGEVGPILEGGSSLAPGERQPGPRVPAVENKGLFFFFFLFFSFLFLFLFLFFYSCIRC